MTRYLVVAALAAFIAAGCSSKAGSPSSTSRADTSATNSRRIPISSLKGKIIFTRAGGKYGDETLYVANANGTNERRISGYGKTCCVAWAPDGKQILTAAMTGDNRGTTGFLKPDGTQLRTLPLPSGKLNLGCANADSRAIGRLACEGWSDEHPELCGVYTIGLDGSDLVRVTRCTQTQDDRPFGFSRDGSRIFFSRANLNFPSIGDQLGASLFSVKADGTDLQRITTAKTPVERIGNPGADLSADGRELVFTSGGAIWTVETDGSHLTKLFDDRRGRLAITPTWSPDKRFILFGLDPPGSLATVDLAPPNGLYVIRADGSGLSPLITGADWKREPDWAAPG